METTKKVNGKKCKKLIIDAMGSWNGAKIALERINPEIHDKLLDATVLAMSMITGKNMLVELAKEFGLNAEISEKEDIILLNGKICMPTIDDK